MTRHAIYSLQDNTLTEISDYGPPPDRPNIRNYSSSQQEMYQRHLEAWQIVMQGYNANKEQYEKTLRTIPTHESARSLWKDGQKVEEGKDYEVKSQFLYSKDPDVWKTFDQPFYRDMAPERFMAFPLPVKRELPLAHIGAGESEDELWRQVVEAFPFSVLDREEENAFIATQKSKYIITKR